MTKAIGETLSALLAHLLAQFPVVAQPQQRRGQLINRLRLNENPRLTSIVYAKRIAYLDWIKRIRNLKIVFPDLSRIGEEFA